MGFSEAKLAATNEDRNEGMAYRGMLSHVVDAITEATLACNTPKKCQVTRADARELLA